MNLGSLLGSDLEEDFSSFNLSEVQSVLSQLQNTDPFDISHAEMLQQQALRGADILSEFIGKIVKTTSVLEARANKLKNKTSLEYVSPTGTKTSLELKKWAGESSPEVEEIYIRLAQAKGAKSLLEKKYEVLIKLHHHFKDIAAGLRKTILGHSLPADKSDSGWG